MPRKNFNHGFAQSDWDAAKDEARKILIEHAKLKRTIAYSELAKRITRIQLDAYDARLFHFLGEIASEEDDKGRGLLSALVVHKSGDREPGAGFFDLARSRGRNVANKEKCWIEELTKVFDYWATH